MLFFSLFFFIGAIYVTRIPFGLLYKNAKKSDVGAPYKNIDGYDNRQLTENVTDILVIRAHFIKRDLIRRLKDVNIVDQEKTKMIYASHLLDDLNPNILRGPNYTKGLRW